MNQTKYSSSAVPNQSFNLDKPQSQHSQILQESHLKVIQLEHDLMLKEMKLQLQEMSTKHQVDELKQEIQKLEISVSKLAKDKVELLKQKDHQIRKGKLELK
jgi:hypothetical protein